MVKQSFGWQQADEPMRLVQASGAAQDVHLAIGQLDRFGHQVALEQNLNRQVDCASIARQGSQLAASIGHALQTKTVGHARQKEAAEHGWIRPGFDLAIARVEEDIGEWQRHLRGVTGQQGADHATVEGRQQRGALEHVLLGHAQRGVQVLGHALELLGQLGHLLLAQGQATAHVGREERGDAGRTAEQAGEAIGGQAPQNCWAKRRQGCDAGLVAQQGQVAEDRRRLEHVQANAVGAAFEQTFTQDVQPIRAGALGEDHLARVEGDFLEGSREAGAVDWRELGKRRHGRQRRRGLSDGLAGAVRNGHELSAVSC